MASSMDFIFAGKTATNAKIIEEAFGITIETILETDTDNMESTLPADVQGPEAVYNALYEAVCMMSEEERGSSLADVVITAGDNYYRMTDAQFVELMTGCIDHLILLEGTYGDISDEVKTWLSSDADGYKITQEKYNEIFM